MSQAASSSLRLPSQNDHVEVDIAIRSVDVLFLNNLGRVLMISSAFSARQQAYREEIGTLTSIERSFASSVKFNDSLFSARQLPCPT